MKLSIIIGEAVTRSPIRATEPLDIHMIDPEEDWELADKVYQIANQVGIRPNRNKDVRIVAVVGDEIVGGIFDEIHHDDHSYDEPVEVYSFDCVVSPQWQGYQGVGLKLIQYAIDQAQSLDVQLIELFVVNRRLIPILCDKFGFEGEWGSGAAMLYKWINKS